MRADHPHELDFSWLTPEAQVALLARILHRKGYADYGAGHITLRDADGTLLTNPYPLDWDEVRASDVVRICAETGELLEGRWPPTPAIALHVELHRARPDVAVAVHNHPEWTTVWAALAAVPPAYDQTSTYLRQGVCVFDEYERDVADADVARRNIEGLGSRSAAILANHGALVVAETVPLAHLRCIALEHRSKLAWRVQAVDGRGGRPMAPAAAAWLADRIDRIEEDRRAWPYAWEAAVRRELRTDRSVLD